MGAGEATPTTQELIVYLDFSSPLKLMRLRKYTEKKKIYPQPISSTKSCPDC